MTTPSLGDARFVVERELGRGGFGVVHKAFDQALVRHVAIKRLPAAASKGTRAAHAEAEAEFALMQRLQHPNVVSVLERVARDDSLDIVMEWVPGGSVANLVHEHGRLHESVVRRMLRDVLSGVAYLHANSVVHQDLKPSNMLLAADGTVKISDFGASRELGGGGSVATRQLSGTVRFMSPAGLSNPRRSRAEDVWALAASACAMLSGTQPWAERFPVEEFELMPLIFNIGRAVPPDHHPAVPPHASSELRALLLRCFAYDPAERPTAADLLRDPYFADVTQPLASGTCESMEAFMAWRQQHLLAVAKAAAAQQQCSAGGGGGYAFAYDSGAPLAWTPAGTCGTNPVFEPPQPPPQPPPQTQQPPTAVTPREPDHQLPTASPVQEQQPEYVWEYTMSRNHFLAYSAEANASINERFREQGGRGKFNLTIEILGGMRWEYEIDFDRMTQTNVRSKKQRVIRIRPGATRAPRHPGLARRILHSLGGSRSSAAAAAPATAKMTPSTK